MRYAGVTIGGAQRAWAAFVYCALTTANCTANGDVARLRLPALASRYDLHGDFKAPQHCRRVHSLRPVQSASPPPMQALISTATASCPCKHRHQPAFLPYAALSHHHHRPCLHLQILPRTEGRGASPHDKGLKMSFLIPTAALCAAVGIASPCFFCYDVVSRQPVHYRL